MPGAWLSANVALEYVRSQEVLAGALYEFRLYGDDFKDQGVGIFQAVGAAN